MLGKTFWPRPELAVVLVLLVFACPVVFITVGAKTPWWSPTGLMKPKKSTSVSKAP